MAASNAGEAANDGKNHVGTRRDSRRAKKKNKKLVKHEAGIVEKDNSRPESGSKLSKKQKAKKAAAVAAAGAAGGGTVQQGGSTSQKPQQPYNPPKSKKSKKRQRAAAAAAATAAAGGPGKAQSGTSTPQGVKSKSSTPVPTASPWKRNSNGNGNSNTDANAKLKSNVNVKRDNVKGKNRGNMTLSLEDGEVDELAGLFFVDTKPQAVKHIPDHIPRPILPVRKPRSRSITPVKQTFDEKVLPDYVGSTNEVQGVNAVTDQGLQPVASSSKDLLVRPPNPPASLKGKERALDIGDDGDDDAYRHQSDLAGTAVNAAAYTIGEEVTLPSRTSKSPPHSRTHVLEDLSSDEGSTSSDEEGRAPVRDQGDAGHHSSQSESDDDDLEITERDDDLALNMIVDTVGETPRDEKLRGEGKGSTSGHVNDEKDSRAGATQSAVNGLQPFIIDLDKSGEDLDELAEAEMADEPYDADASRYFKEDDPLRVCARCGETGHVVRDCVHVQCLTCGKLDDHGTRSCPLTMTCFRCNSRGHHIKDCPVSAERARASANQFCERCSSHTHKSSTCPYIWRVYIRAADAPVKPPKIHLACYNCASADHFGDECRIPRGPFASFERTAFTLDSDNPRKSHIRFDSSSAGSNPMPRPNIVNGRTQPSHQSSRIPTGSSASSQSNQRNGRDALAERMAQRPSLGDQIRRDGDFGDMSNLEAGEIDEEEESFARRLDANKAGGEVRRQARPGARDRRNKRTGGSGSVTPITIDDDSDSHQSYQPFKHIREPPGVSSLHQPRSLSGSPPPRKRRRDERQPSPAPLDDSVGPYPSRQPANRGSSRPHDSHSSYRDERRRPTDSGHRTFAAGSLLDRIERGSATSSSASRDPRRYNDRARVEDRRSSGYSDIDRGRSDDRSRPDRSAGVSVSHPRYRGGYF